MLHGGIPGTGGMGADIDAIAIDAKNCFHHSGLALREVRIGSPDVKRQKSSWSDIAGFVPWQRMRPLIGLRCSCDRAELA